MAWIVGFISQKGGVGKSTKARALAREASACGIKTKLADLDLEQATSAEWHRRRLSAGLSPVASVEVFSTAKQAIESAGDFDLLILSRVGTEAEELDARAYISEAGYETLSGCLFEKPAYRKAMNSGLAVTETRYKGLNERADELIQALIDKIGEE